MFYFLRGFFLAMFYASVPALVLANSMQTYFSKTGNSGYISPSSYEKSKEPVNVYSLTPYQQQYQPPVQQYQPPVQQYQPPVQQYQPPFQYNSYNNYYNPRRQNAPQGRNVANYNGNIFMFKKYYALSFAHPFNSSYSYTANNSQYSVSKSGLMPLIHRNGMLSVSTGKRFNTIPNLRREFGAQWELLSFEEKFKSGKSFKVKNHNISVGGKLFYDFPISVSSYFTIGGELNYGIINHIVADDQVITTALSYGILGGFVQQISNRKALYIMLRQSTIPNKTYMVVNTTRKNADIRSTSIMIGLQVFSM